MTVGLGCLALWVGLFPGCGTGERGDVEVHVRGVVMDPQTDSPVLFLLDRKTDRGVPIWIGMAEARAIARGLQGITSPRPQTHDLTKNLLDTLGATVERVVITDLKDGTYYARLHLRSGRKTWEVDSRPSDAVALALQFGAPVFLSRALVDQGVLVDLPGAQGGGWLEDAYGFSVQEMSSGVAAYFGRKRGEGVIVTEVHRGGLAHGAGLRSGDILVRVAGRRVASKEEVLQALRGSGEGGDVRVKVHRGGDTLTLSMKRKG